MQRLRFLGGQGHIGKFGKRSGGLLHKHGYLVEFDIAFGLELLDEILAG